MTESCEAERSRWLCMACRDISATECNRLTYYIMNRKNEAPYPEPHLDAVTYLLAANRGSNCSLGQAMDACRI